MTFRTIRFDYLVSIGCLVMLSYFAWHAWYGPRSYAYVAKLESQRDALVTERQGLQKHKDGLTQQVSLMRPESVDPDMLEELARQNLGWVGANELVIKVTP